ncbi:hypothetical protein KSU03_05675 [Fusobacterium polymorphum]|uniref:hypothetical protein n=1 Tax=Fusobacterium nucleatum subsp. polymorphum TaxID=76857 RepID=UPI00164E684D|nr:hypothetical protein [Fusobacterium polymorphum]
MNKQEIEKSLKRYLKKKVSYSLSLLMVVCQIVLIKKFRLTINIIKRIFLRIKS